MGTEESNKLGAYYNFLEPKDEAPNNPLLPNWTTSFQAFYNSGSTPTPLLNPHAAGSYPMQYVWPNQMNNTTLQHDFLHDQMNLSNNSTVAGVILNQQQQQQQPSIVPLATDAALIFSEKVRTMFGGNKLDSMKKCDRSSQPKSSKTKKSRENENKCSTPSNDKDVVSVSGASKESPDENHDNENDFPPAKKQERNVVLENANSTEQNKNLGTGVNASNNISELAKLEKAEKFKERKRKSNRESAKRSRMRKQKECEELHRNMDILKGENSALTQKLMRLSEECMELCNENDSIQEELVKMYGAESIADLLPMKPA